jgi:hypothetical protein
MTSPQLADCSNQGDGEMMTSVGLADTDIDRGVPYRLAQLTARHLSNERRRIQCLAGPEEGSLLRDREKARARRRAEGSLTRGVIAALGSAAQRTGSDCKSLGRAAGPLIHRGRLADPLWQKVQLMWASRSVP